MVPNGWEILPFSDIATIGNGQVDPKEEPYLSMKHIGPENVISHSGQLVDLHTSKELALISGKYFFDDNSIVYSKIRPNLNKVCTPNFVGICSADMYPIWAKPFVNKNFLFQYMLGPIFNKIAISFSMRTGMPKINRTELNSIEVAIPPIEEQQKIAEILSTWDKAIDATEKLISNSQTQKRALMQQLLTGKKRLLDENGEQFSGKWNIYSLEDLENLKWISLGRGKIISKQDMKTHQGNYPIYSSSVKNSGIMGKYGDYMFDEEMITWSIDGGGNFFHRPRHKFSVTNVCGYMQTDKSSINSMFLASQLQLLHLKLHFDYQTKAHPSVIRKLYNVHIPELPEQTKIAKVLSDADREIEFLEKKLEYLKQEKKALMQQLLTGKRLVKTDN